MTGSKPLIFRFAPSPNGRLHLGHARSALVNAARARASGGILLVRMEDIDRDRCRKDYETAILEDLSWLGISWATPVLRQSEHFARYRLMLQDLAERRLVYPCFCSRQDVTNAVAGLRDWSTDPDGVRHYPGTCRVMNARQRSERLAQGQAYSWRLDNARAIAAVGKALSFTELGPHGAARRVEAQPQLWGDVILGRKDVPASYHLAVVADDAFQGVTDVVRGEDLKAATHLHRLLQALFDLPTPSYFHHLNLVDALGRKLAKSHGAKSLSDWRTDGFGAADIRALALGSDPDRITGILPHKMASFP
ncbi:MAG: tRNA glutamyl-Q(34) synthetase GluQRS [Hyphomicrobiales bacterium]|nr:tRNA glutamyl-Q(34) synthetase GluQRS [Hyphomicrobiales bacterium]